MADTAQPIEVDVPDPWTLPLEGFDVSKAEIYQQNKQGEYFRRLREEAPMSGPAFDPEADRPIVAVPAE